MNEIWLPWEFTRRIARRDGAPMRCFARCISGLLSVAPGALCEER
jgi:hypothetical protein